MKTKKEILKELGWDIENEYSVLIESVEEAMEVYHKQRIEADQVDAIVNGQTLTNYGFKKVDGKHTKLYSPKSLPPRRIVVKPAEWNVDNEGKHDFWRVEIEGKFIANIDNIMKLETVILVFTDFEQSTFAH